ncbi:glycine cleavage system protein H [uncultured Sulfitobacter sp.]|uniref:glycine cleavage system protein H n=1 Tax=uncultured Sulfitobacter sp. TaxID=191468 RepID=UPI002632863C|nr:glycine cleavage system protein H [uncultured Sulfitobacter sp.]
MRFTEEHLWLRKEDGEDDVIIGLSTYAIDELGEAKFVELPEEGDVLVADDPAVVIEGEDTLDVLAPLDGEVTEVNTRLVENPEVISDDPMGDGWLFRMTLDDPDAYDELMTEAAYQKYIR